MGKEQHAPRIAPLAPPYDEPTRRTLERWMPAGFDVEPLKLFRTLAVSPELASRMYPLAAGLLGHGSLDARDREIVIHRTTALSGAEYEWGVHAVAFGGPVGLTREQLRATVDGDASSPAWSSDRDRLLVRLCDELHAHATVSAALWEQLEREWSEQQLLELLVLAGWYRTISYIVNGLRIEHEPWAQRFDPAAAVAS
jgi:alkylhydroperoxidase family enzyme